jgi:thiol-disulfide isomerase/thioredoxin
MSDVRSDGPKKGGLLKIAIISVAVVGVAAILYVIASASFKPKPTGDLVEMRTGSLAKLEVPGHARPRDPRTPDLDRGVSPAAAPAPDAVFTGPDGKPMKVADLKGKVVVLNLWATWCAPCKIEMPTLAKLQAAYAAQPLQVVTLSADSPDKLAEAQAFLDKNPPLKLSSTGGSTFLFKFTPPVTDLPVTILYDKKGIERARLPGGADWNSKEARALIERLLGEAA